MEDYLNKAKNTLFIEGVLDSEMCSDSPMVCMNIDGVSLFDIISKYNGLNGQKVKISIEIVNKKLFPTDPEYQKFLDKYKIKTIIYGTTKVLYMEYKNIEKILYKTNTEEYYKFIMWIREHRRLGFVETILFVPGDIDKIRIPKELWDLVTVSYLDKRVKVRVDNRSIFYISDCLEQVKKQHKP